MNKMRFGAILVSMDWQVGFYLSHRVVLTTPYDGVVHAVSYEEFGKCKVFARNGVAVSCFEAMMRAIETKRNYKNSLEMVCTFLNLPIGSDSEDLCEYMERNHGAVFEDFEIKAIREEPDSLLKS